MDGLFQEKNAKAVDSGVDALWAKLSSRALRAVLARQGIGYAELAAALAAMNITESGRSVEGKAQRGTFRLVFFLQALCAAGADCPVLWEKPMAGAKTWEGRATAVLEAELARQPWLTWKAVSNRLGEIGVLVSTDALEAEVRDGAISMARFLQCATVVRFEGVGQFIDISSLNRAALAGADLTA